ncbi:hypothetical protein A3Q56_03303 [Intoshia linei]|uniref:Non-specific serine/threonine protein kinase n=1 Tax=Intoshia linei TaxID=1819745 RepID=A0A177B452_9BILA|nr:hypothetical protein A3Q56_03303 [Intoshia linei]
MSHYESPNEEHLLDDDFMDGTEFYNNIHTDEVAEEIAHQIKNRNTKTDVIVNKSEEKRVSINDFSMIKLLGRGGYGRVFLTKKISGYDQNTYYAMKILKKVDVVKSKIDTAHTKSERQIMAKIKHPFLVDLIYAFQTGYKLYLIMEYVPGGEIYTQLETNVCIPEEDTVFYVSEVVLALEYLHKIGIIYRDLKPENILITIEGHIKMTDFGLCKEALVGSELTHTFCGTIDYMSPEILNHTGHNKSCDWWSLGCLVYDMLSGRPPFSSSTRQKTIYKILHCKVHYPRIISTKSKAFINKIKYHIMLHCLRKDYKNRLGSGPGDANHIKKEAFFHRLNWDDVFQKRRIPPMKPKLKSWTDVSAFDIKFTSENIVGSPNLTPISDSLNEAFLGFSYVSANYKNAQIQQKQDEEHFYKEEEPNPVIKDRRIKHDFVPPPVNSIGKPFLAKIRLK